MYKYKGPESKVLNILLIDDDEDDFIIIQDMLENVEGQRYRLTWAETYQEGLAAIYKGEWDAVLVDFDLGNKDGIELLREVIFKGMEGPFIMVTGRGNREKDVEAMQAGASEYVTKKELSSALMERIIRYARERMRVEKELEERVKQRTIELQSALEELRVTEEELRVQFEEIDQIFKNQKQDAAHFEHLFENAPLAYITTDKYGAVRQANKKAVDLLKVDIKYIKGKPLASFVNEEDKREFRRKIASMQQERSKMEWKYVFQPRNGSTIPLRIIVSPITNHKKDVKLLFWQFLEEKN